MRKILVGVLSVAGLLAVVLALASSPAAATPTVIPIATDDTGTSEAGTYTVTWSTKGGCDPGAGTSGASGSVTLTVADADGPGANTTGGTDKSAVVTESDCAYTWKASFVKADGTHCKLADPVPDPTDGIELDYVAGNCNSVETVTFTVAPYTKPQVLCTQDEIDGSSAGDPCFGGSLGTAVKTKAGDPTALDKGAVKGTAFTVTAVQKVAAGAEPDPDCATVSGETAVNDDGDNVVKLSLTDGTQSGTDCIFTVTAVAAGFDVVDAGDNSAAVYMNGPHATTNRATLDTASTTSTAALEVEFKLTVAKRTVYLVQNVSGDAGGASATYKYEAPCGVSGLPVDLLPNTGSGGIQSTNSVELRDGRWNVSAAIGDNSQDGTKADALDDKGKACSATVSISNVPDHCTTDASQSANLADAEATVILEFTIQCTPPAEPAPEPPADDGGDMADDGGDMMDDGGDMMDDGGGDMMDDGDAGDGPMMDAPTG